MTMYQLVSEVFSENGITHFEYLTSAALDWSYYINYVFYIKSKQATIKNYRKYEIEIGLEFPLIL